jgi:uncharacterized cupredoxin-like copper-binding protein
MKTARKLTVLTAGLALALAACGGNGGTGTTAAPTTTPGPSPQEVNFIATEFQFDPSEVTVSAGSPVTIKLVNEGVLEHDLVIDGFTFDLLVQPGEEATETVTFDAGTYVFWCTIPGHREAGMEGTLTAE